MRASAAASKRDFLRSKGLTEAEIDEAFRRVPQDATPAAAPSPAPAAAAPAAAAPSAVATTLQHLQPQPYAQQPGAMVPYQPPQPQGVRWTQVRVTAPVRSRVARLLCSRVPIASVLTSADEVARLRPPLAAPTLLPLQPLFCPRSHFISVCPSHRPPQVVLGAGFLAASAYAAKSLLWPYMEGAYYSVRSAGLS